MHSMTCPLSSATIREAFATESWGNPVASAFRRTFPGAFAHLRLLVRTGKTISVGLNLVARDVNGVGSEWHCQT